jgi:alpha-amylase
MCGGVLLSLGLLSVLGCASSGSSTATSVSPASSAFLTEKNPFSWDNATVYFVVTDRFQNGNPKNDRSYGREKDGEKEIGTFHGGDLKGLTQKLNEGYFKNLGVNALWITAPYQQVMGWVVGGDREFKHYAYHGYYALDYTVMDANMGTEDELREFIDTAHQQGIRVLFDVVMNHPGYADIQTLEALKVNVLWEGYEEADPATFYNYIDYNNPNFKDWWGKWVRADLPGSASAGVGDLTSQLAHLPDFRTESNKPVKLPTFLKNKPDTKAKEIEGYTVRKYLIKWLTDWVREYGVDGFRCDTVKHVEKDAWKELKDAGVLALRDWKAKNPTKKLDDQDFWMVGEVWGHGLLRDSYFDNGFDALINFELQETAENLRHMENVYAEYARELNADASFNMLSYLSSHDTKLFPNAKRKDGATFLMLMPGAVQIYYGDESGREPSEGSATDPQQETRSPMNWDSVDEALLSHWQKLGEFRSRHLAVGMGDHQKLADKPYVFSRVLKQTQGDAADRVVIAVGAEGKADISVSNIFAEGSHVRDSYTGETYQVAAGKVSVQAAPEGVVLLEAAP